MQSKEHLLLRALKGESVDRPPVWMMGQAGRYLPDYVKLSARYDYNTRLQTPELACEIALQPVDQIGVDAAILFSDILVIPQAMGMTVHMEEGKGPVLPEVIRSEKEVEALFTDDMPSRLASVMEALKLTRQALNGRVPLIGFAGAPWTLLCYMVEGKCSNTFEKAKQFCYTNPSLAHRLLQKITEVTISFLNAQAAAGADLVQVFDSSSGLLSPEDFNTFALPYLQQIVKGVRAQAPVILFPRGSWYALPELARTGAAGLGIDWCIEPKLARRMTEYNITLQGNLDPSILLGPIPEIKSTVARMIDAFGVQRYIANLGHRILPNVPVDHVRAFVDAVKGHKAGGPVKWL